MLMRQMGRLDLACNTTSLYNIISGKRFDKVMDGVMKLVSSTENEEGIKVFQLPSLALRLGHNIAKCAQIKMSICLRQDDDVGYGEADKFLKLHANEWTDRVSTVALATLKTNHFQKPELLPLTDDHDGGSN